MIECIMAREWPENEGFSIRHRSSHIRAPRKMMRCGAGDGPDSCRKLAPSHVLPPFRHDGFGIHDMNNMLFHGHRQKLESYRIAKFQEIPASKIGPMFLGAASIPQPNISAQYPPVGADRKLIRSGRRDCVTEMPSRSSLGDN